MSPLESIFFYEREYYVFSNFSSFAIEWKGKVWMTSEHAYHAERFSDKETKEKIRNMRSAHEVWKFAQDNKHIQITNWNDIKVEIMKDILREKIVQHPYVKKKLLESGEREIVEDSPSDNFWGVGPNKDGKNQLGKLWMELREEIKVSI